MIKYKSAVILLGEWLHNYKLSFVVPEASNHKVMHNKTIIT